MDGCPNLSSEEVANMKTFINGMTNKSYDSKYEKKLIDTSIQTKLSYYNETIDITDFKIIGQCTKLTQLNLRNTKVEKTASEVLDTNEDTVEKLMNNVFSNLTNLQYLTINNFTIKIGDTAKKVSDLEFLPSSIIFVDLQNTDVVAMGDTSASTNTTRLDSTTNLLSIKNTNKLNGLTKLSAIGINTSTFDFSKLQTMLERFKSFGACQMEDSTFIGSTSSFRGLMCTNWTSLKTLEKCNQITWIITTSRIGGIWKEETEILDLSGCDRLVGLDYYGWYNFTVKFPNTINEIYGLVTTIHLEFESSENGDPININRIGFDEVQGSEQAVRLSELANSNIKVKNLNVTAILSDYEVFDSLLRNGKFDWVENLKVMRAPYNGDAYDNKLILESLNTLVDTEFKRDNLGLKGMQLIYFSKSNLSDVMRFTSITTLGLEQSKIVDLGDIEPKYDGNGKCVSGFPNLKEIYSINPSANSVTDLTPLGTISTLESINFSGNKINKGIEVLAGLRNLKIINLINCNSLLQNRKLCGFI